MLLERLREERTGRLAHFGIGATPQARPELIPYLTAAELGYETPELSHCSEHELQKPRCALKSISREAAAATLAFAAASSIAYGGHRPPAPALTALAQEALLDLDDQARFFSDADWPSYWGSSSFGISGISNSTFDAGVGSYDDERAFIFWMKKED